ncbi:hypothetical protein VV02_00635 [Luteipulveratus mongoliensis]|uniref:N-acetyltransferase domain-containing protein n=2 Tax=Luteipulveratus mongoliensis TaxID=571913 RepID=A0A0K1JP60_9MICO|nr:hypothetical protein VV02_00635 [Luteipulveratus mongoliensis]
MTWPPAAGTELEGEFVRLRQISPEADSSALFAALDADAVWSVFGAPRPPTPEALAGGLGYLGGLPGRFQWLVIARETTEVATAGEVLGMSSYYDVSEGDARLEIGATAYNPSVWSTHVNPETKLLLLRYAFAELGCGRVQFRTDVRNTRSQSAIARLGAAYEGTLRRYDRRPDGTVRDTVLFSITAQDWPAVERGLIERVGHATRSHDI